MGEPQPPGEHTPHTLHSPPAPAGQTLADHPRQTCHLPAPPPAPPHFPKFCLYSFVHALGGPLFPATHVLTHACTMLFFCTICGYSYNFCDLHFQKNPPLHHLSLLSQTSALPAKFPTAHIEHLSVHACGVEHANHAIPRTCLETVPLIRYSVCSPPRYQMNGTDRPAFALLHTPAAADMHCCSDLQTDGVLAGTARTCFPN